jgi:glycosyltransferase involved in cell wall biosynthesis
MLMTTSETKVSIITIVLNKASSLEKTIQSVAGQDYPHIEYIIVDGGSEDGAVDIIKKYKEHITFWLSEPDNGPFDAMNKGLAKATGEWVMFMNAGDTFAGPTVLSEIFSKDASDADVIYGDWITDYKSFSLLRKAGSPADLRKGMVFSHQAIAVRTVLARQCGFNSAYRIGADYDMVYNLYASGKRFRYFPAPVALVETMGISHRNMVKSAKEHYTILCRYKNPSALEKIFHYKKIYSLWVIELAYHLLPMNLLLAVIKIIWRKDLVQTTGGEEGFRKTT